MDELILPKIQKSETGGGVLPGGYERYIIPSGMTSNDRAKLALESLQPVVDKQIELDSKFEKYKDKVEEYKKELEGQNAKNIEIIGIFSAILALLIIDVNIAKSFDSFLSAILLVVALTCSMVIFISLVHLFFTPLDRNKLGKVFWIPNIILGILIFVGLFLYFFNIDINKIKPKAIINSTSTCPIIK